MSGETLKKFWNWRVRLWHDGYFEPADGFIFGFTATLLANLITIAHVHVGESAVGLAYALICVSVTVTLLSGLCGGIPGGLAALAGVAIALVPISLFDQPMRWFVEFLFAHLPVILLVGFLGVLILLLAAGPPNPNGSYESGGHPY